jgi:hypothetical protein
MLSASRGTTFRGAGRYAVLRVLSGYSHSRAGRNCRPISVCPIGRSTYGMEASTHCGTGAGNGFSTGESEGSNLGPAFNRGQHFLSRTFRDARSRISPRTSRGVLQVSDAAASAASLFSFNTQQLVYRHLARLPALLPSHTDRNLGAVTVQVCTGRGLGTDRNVGTAAPPSRVPTSSSSRA